MVKKESATKKQKSTRAPIPTVTNGPVRWEHSFASDFGPNWHLVYTSDESVKATQRARWVEQLMGKEMTEPELVVRDVFDYSNFHSYYKSQFMVFENIIRSVMTAPAASLGLGGQRAMSAQTSSKRQSSEIGTKNQDDNPSGFILLNGSVKIRVGMDKPFVIGASCGNDPNDLGKDVTCPDLNLKNLTSKNKVANRHCVISHNSKGWNVSSKDGIVLDGEHVTGSHKLRNNSVIVIANEIVVKFFY